MAECPNCNCEFPATNNMEISCPECDTEFVYCEDDLLTMWD